MHSLEGMIKNPSQYSLADLRINLRISIPHLWNSDLKEEGLMNVFAGCLKKYSMEQKNASVRERKHCLYFASSQTCFKANRLNSLGCTKSRCEG